MGKYAGTIFLLTVTHGFADTVIFPHEGALILSRVDGNEPGLFVYETAKQKGAAHFLPSRRVGDAVKNLVPSFPEGKLRLISQGKEYGVDREKGLVEKKVLSIPHASTERCLWSLADYNGDGRTDVIVFLLTAPDAKARIFYGRADGTYAEPFVFQLDGKEFDATGIRSPHFVNLDDDDDLDFLHLNAEGRLIYYENRNTNSEPLYAAGLALGGTEKTFIDAVCPFDWNADGHTDLIIVTRDGAIGYLPHRGSYQNGLPVFSPLVSLIASPTSP